jgi:hypothetical protein
MHMQICPDLARLTRMLKDYALEATPTAPGPGTTEGEIEGDMDYEAAAPLSAQGEVFAVVDEAQPLALHLTSHFFHPADAAC